ncbi:MAG: cysteine desulfurase [Gemmatimonadetes bacterium]|nr:cysteine desulfurase [Gemmatimonadota bacterium]
MPTDPIYLDYSATAPLRREAREAMLPYMEGCFGNPSSLHRWGREARAALDDARDRLAAVIGAAPSEVVFTRGGTEADNMAVLGRAHCMPQAPVVCSAIEHKAVLATVKAAARLTGAPFHVVPVDGDGVVREEQVYALLEEKPSVVSVMWANNEVGAVQPIERLADRCKEAGVSFHTDAVQAFGKLPVRVDEVPVSLLSVSAHKVGGPRGVGALFVRKGTRLHPLIYGGSQERGLRPGTEDVAGAVGLAVAAELAVRDREADMVRLGALRDRLEAGLRAAIPDLVVNAATAKRLATVLSVCIPGADAGALIPALDLEGIAASGGSACSSGSSEPSYVLVAMGLDGQVAAPSARFSLGKETTAEEIERVLATVPAVVERLRSFASA